MSNQLRADIRVFLDAMESSGYGVEVCKIFFRNDNIHIYIWSESFRGQEPLIAEEAYNYFNATKSEFLDVVCSGLWVDNPVGGYVVRR